MRMTNKIMQANSLYNINQTKILEDKYNTQLTSQSKITRPSDDPVIAIRALRLRSNVSTVTQYYKKNSPDANQWLDVTAQSLNTITDVLKNLYNQVQTGVNKDYTASDMDVLLTQIDAYTHEMYATGNQDYAGRYIFTGYRTDTALTMDETASSDDYIITEVLKEAQLDSFKYTDFSVFDTTASAAVANENHVTNATINRFRLSYNDLVGAADKLPSITMTKADGTPLELTGITDATGAISASDITYFDDSELAYQAMTKVENGTATTPKIAYVPSTGEILFSSDTAKVLGDAMTDGAKISVTYEKTKWSEEDLNPQHFFRCNKGNVKYGADGTIDIDASFADGITYNDEGDVDTKITYDVGYNQVIQVNTNAYEVFDPAISRDYADLKELVKQFTKIETIRADLKKELEGYVEGTADYSKCKEHLDAAEKAYTYVRDAVSDRFGAQITRYQNYLDATNVAITKNGTRSTRLELINTRLGSQQSTFKELQEENEGINMTEVAVLLTAAQTTYDAALMATSKITQTSLINYI